MVGELPVRDREGLIRSLRARQKADRLIRAAQEAHSDPGDTLADLIHRIAARLNVERCELLLFGGGPRVQLWRMRADLSPELRKRISRARQIQIQMVGGNASTKWVELGPRQSPLQLLLPRPGAQRVHTFMSGVSIERLLGVMSVEYRTDRQLSLDERALLKAVGDQLARSILRGEFPGIGDEESSPGFPAGDAS